MLYKHYEKYLTPQFQLEIHEETQGRIKTGILVSPQKKIQIQNYIPRFCGLEHMTRQHYTQSFGFQWSRFRTTQLDSKTGLSLSADRVYSCSKWDSNELKGKTVLDIGCGPGRFTEVLLKAQAQVVSVDASQAVDVCYENHACDTLFLMQADLFHLPLLKKSFDFVLCYGVLQHTPDPLAAFQVLLKYLKPGGNLSADNYIYDFFSPFCNPKYFWRPLAKRLNSETLLKIIQWYIPKYLPLDTAIRKIPRFGPRLLSLIPIPCWNYIDKGFSDEERLQWAVLDTFDALSPQHDIPKTKNEFVKCCKKLSLAQYEVFYGGNGIVVNVVG